MASFWKLATSNAFNTALNGNIGAVDTSMTLNNTTGLQTPLVLVIDRVNAGGTSTPTVREYVSATTVAGANVSGLTRALGGSTAQSHSSGAIVEEVFTMTHWNDLLTLLLNVFTSSGTLDTTKVVDLTSVQTLTNKTLTSPTINTPTITTPLVETEYSNGTQTGTYNIDWSKGDRQNVIISGNITFTFSNAVAGQNLTLWVVENATGGFTITTPTIKYPGGTAPTWTTTANAINAIIIRYDGTSYFGQAATGFA